MHKVSNNHIKIMVRDGRLKDALNTYLQQSENKINTDFVNNLSHRYHNLERQKDKGVLYEKEYQTELNKILDAFLTFLSDDHRGKTILSITKKYWLLSAVAFLILVLGIFIFSRNDIPPSQDRSTSVKGDNNNVYNMEGENATVNIHSDSLRINVRKNNESNNH